MSVIFPFAFATFDIYEYAYVSKILINLSGDLRTLIVTSHYSRTELSRGYYLLYLPYVTLTLI